jgi:hypothetical protein
MATSLVVTTLAGAVTAADFNQTIRVASATGQAKGNLINIDSEWLTQSVDSQGSVTLQVQGGKEGGYCQTHASGAVVFMGLPSDFPSAPPGSGTLQPVSPNWTSTTYTAAGAIAIPTTKQNVFVKLLSGAASAMTLANPTAAQEGQEMIIMAGDAQAYTVTNPGGFLGTTTSSDVATFNGAIGSALHIRAVNLFWLVISGITAGVSVA